MPHLPKINLRITLKKYYLFFYYSKDKNVENQLFNLENKNFISIFFYKIGTAENPNKLNETKRCFVMFASLV